MARPLLTLTVVALCSLLLASSAAPAVAQTDLSWKTLTNFDAIDIVPDPEDPATFWIAGHGGLHRYEATTGSWQTYTTADGLSKIWTEAVLAEPDVVWVGTEDGGANRFDRSTRQFTPFLQEETTEPLTVWALAADEDYVWAGTDSGLFQVDRSTLQTVEHYTADDGLGSNDVTALVDDGAHLWVASSYNDLGVGLAPDVGGLSRLNKTTGAVDHFTLPGSEASDYFYALADAGDTLWVGGRAGLYVFDKGPEHFTVVAPDVIPSRVQSLIVADDAVWCTAIRIAPELLYRVDRRTFEVTDSLTLPEPTFGSSARVARLAAAPQHVLVARGEHLLRVPMPFGEAVAVQQPLLPFPYTDGLAASEEAFFAGSNDVLLKVGADLDVMAQRSLFDDAQKKVRAVRVDGDAVWVGTHDGLLRLRASDLATQQSFFPGTRVQPLEMDAPYLWASPGRGLSRVDTRTNEQTTVPLGEQLNVGAEPLVRALVADEAALWIAYAGTRDDATVEGIARLDRGTLSVTDRVEAGDHAGLRGLETLAAHGDYLYAGGATVTQLAKADLSAETLTEHVARLLRVRDGRLWLAFGTALGDGGVHVYDLDAPDAGPLLVLDEEAGLSHNYVTDLQFAPDGQHVWMATYAGLNVLDVSSAEALPAEGPAAPSTMRLEPGYPNPFVTTTVLPFTTTSAGRVRLVVYDLLGREVAVLLDAWRPAGRDHVQWQAHDVAAGLYVARLCVSAAGTEQCAPARQIVHADTR